MEPRAYEQLIAQEGRHWWFRARRRIVRAVLRRHVPRGGRVLEVGAGAGGNIPMLREWGAVTALEPNPLAADYLARRFGVEPVREAIPLRAPTRLGRFDTVVALDVLEHVRDDAAALRSLRASLRPRGTLVVTVPAFEFLWSSHDVALHHERRYRKGALVARMRDAGFDIRFASYFGVLLLPPAALLRGLDRFRAGAGQWGADAPHPWIDALLYAVFAAEAHLLGRVSFPAGLSVIAVGRAAHGEGPWPSSRSSEPGSGPDSL